MTYTYKLARRLAVSREFTMLPALLLIAACVDDTTGPDALSGTHLERKPATLLVRIVPKAVTLEAGQTVRFRADAGEGRRFHHRVLWHSSGGTIDADGTFSASTVGTYKVTGRGRGRHKADTSTVIVVPPQPDLAGVRITPDSASIHAGDSLTFAAVGVLADGSTAPIGVTWAATGGSIDAGGEFKAGNGTGLYRVVATSNTSAIADTVQVRISEPPPPPPSAPSLATVTLAPGSASLTSGAALQFAAYGRTTAGDSVAVDATFRATGGTITSAGLYTAGSTTGTFRVIATSTSDSLADTARVTISAPTLVQVVLRPSSPSVSTGGTKQFTVWGRMSNGDSVAVTASFTATGGTISSGGLYTAGQTPGTYRVIASSSGQADTAAVSVTSTDAGGGTGGISFGPYNLWAQATSLKAGSAEFTVSINSAAPNSIVTQIDAARTKGQKLIIVMMGPAAEYLTNGNFDLGKWKARVDQFNTSAIRTAIAEGVSDGTVVGHKLIDEPEHKKWGTTVNKSVLDEMASYSKKYFPTAPTGISYGPPGYRWHTDQTFKVLDWVVYQYNWAVRGTTYDRGDVTGWRDDVLRQAQVDGVAPAFSLNILDGGVRDLDDDGSWECPQPLTEGQGTYYPNCRMTAAQVATWGKLLGPAGCVLVMWRYDDLYMSRSDNQGAFGDVARALAGRTARSCRRAG
jgi:hypothetical protein